MQYNENTCLLVFYKIDFSNSNKSHYSALINYLNVFTPLNNFMTMFSVEISFMILLE